MNTDSNHSLSFLLRIESLAFAVASIYLYRYIGGKWSTYFLLWLVPDLFMIAYFTGNKIGSYAYNLSHNFFLPCALSLMGFVLEETIATQLGLLWFSHVAIDRTLGYGLKYTTHFRDTHLGKC